MRFIDANAILDILRKEYDKFDANDHVYADGIMYAIYAIEDAETIPVSAWTEETGYVIEEDK